MELYGSQIKHIAKNMIQNEQEGEVVQLLGHQTSNKGFMPTGTNFLSSHIHRVIHMICPEWPACHPQGGGWQATRPVSRVKWLWRHRQTSQNGNVARQDSSNFPTFTSEKYLFGTYKRKIINIYCPLVTEKSTNPRVRLTCPCLGMDKVNLTLGLVDFSVTTGQ